MTSTIRHPGSGSAASAALPPPWGPSWRSHPLGGNPNPGAPTRLPLGGPGGVLVLAHRGCPAAGRPENTVAAVDAALADGADGTEVDVRLTADGTLVCSHDADLSRLAGCGVSIAGSTARDVRSVPLPGGHTVARLDEILRAAQRYGRRRVVVEVKAVSEQRFGLRTAGALGEVLADFHAVLDLRLSSFDPALLRSVRAAVGALPVGTALLGTPLTPAAALLRRAVEDGHDEIHPNVLSLLKEPAVVHTAHSIGMGVTCWTVNERRQVDTLAALGIDAVITDELATARATLLRSAVPARQLPA